MTQDIILNHHSASVLPFYEDLEGKVHLILEEKDKEYKLPFFDNGLNFLGGNWEKGMHVDKSPRELVCREVDEEFWTIFEPTESLNGLLGESFLKREPEVVAKYDHASVQKIKQIGALICSNMRYAGSYIIKIQPPITKTELVHGLTIFTNCLNSEKYKNIESVLKEFDGKLTTDNLKWGSHIVSTTLQEINLNNRKFAWGYCNIVNELMKSGFDNLRPGVIRPLNLVQVSKMEYTLAKGTKEAEIEAGPSFKDFEEAGYKYLIKQKK